VVVNVIRVFDAPVGLHLAPGCPETAFYVPLDVFTARSQFA
jgi:hypothetical protein